MTRKIIIFDTTLRDGEQSPGASLNLREKLEIARQLEKLNVDVIEAGFPITSQGDFDAVESVSKEISGPVICGLARCMKKDIDAAYKALRKAVKPRIHVFLATSKVHMQYKLRKAEKEILRLAVESVRYARELVEDVEFSPEDASRTELGFLAEVFDAVVEAGASTVNIPDTVGYTTPVEFGQVIKHLHSKTDRGRQAIISVHCHNDLGLAVANSLLAVENGARQIECTVNGLGERAGNCSLEEVVMTLKTRKDRYARYLTGINNKQIINTSRLVSKLTGIVVQPNKAIVGENAFAHEAGIHQDGILKERTTYEIMKPSDVGLSESKLVLGKHSGRHAFRNRLEALGHKLSEDELNHAFEAFKDLADKKKNIYDEDITTLIEDELSDIPEVYILDYFSVSAGDKTIPTATVRLKKGNKVLQDASCGDGPVDATYKTIDRITGIKCNLLDYSIRAVTSGKDALGEVAIRIQHGRKTLNCRGASTDIIEASAKAYLNAVNRFIYLKNKNPQSAKK